MAPEARELEASIHPHILEVSSRQMEFALMPTYHGLYRDHKYDDVAGRSTCRATQIPRSCLRCYGTHAVPGGPSFHPKRIIRPHGPRASGGERLARSRATFEGRIGSYQGREIHFEDEPRVQTIATLPNAVDRQLVWEMSVSPRPHGLRRPHHGSVDACSQPRPPRQKQCLVRYVATVYSSEQAERHLPLASPCLLDVDAT